MLTRVTCPLTERVVDSYIGASSRFRPDRLRFFRATLYQMSYRGNVLEVSPGFAPGTPGILPFGILSRYSNFVLNYETKKTGEFATAQTHSCCGPYYQPRWYRVCSRSQSNVTA